MDFKKTLDENYFTELGFSAEIKVYLEETAKWAKFLSIVGFIVVGLMVVGSLMIGLFLGTLFSSLNEVGMPFPPALISIIYLGMSLLVFFPVLYLFRFASKMQKALREEHEQVLTQAFRNLKAHYKFNGIFVAIILGLYVLALMGSIIGGASLYF